MVGPGLPLNCRRRSNAPRPHDSKISIQAGLRPVSPPTVASRSASRSQVLSLKRTDTLAVEAYITASAGDDAGATPPSAISLQLGENKALREASVVPRSIVGASDKSVTK